MAISLNRTEYVAKKLGKLNGDKILDIGCREMILREYLQGNFNYLGLDYISSKSSDPNFINHNLEEGLPSNLNDMTYNNVLLFNVLEHVFNFKNCLKNCHLILKKGGCFCGSTPFFFNIHGSPNDYFRYTEQGLLKILEETGFKNIKVKIICGGIFICFYSSLSRISSKIPLLNNILLIICQSLDFIINIFSKNIRKIFPLGYLFTGNK